MADTSLAKVEQIDAWQSKLELIKQTVAKGVTDNELQLFLYTCKRTGLDPLAKQIYAIKRKQKQGDQWVETMTIQTAIDGYRLIAERTGKYEGQDGPFWCGEDGEWKDVWISSKPPVAARVGVYKTGFRDALYSTARFDAYKQTKSDGSLMGLWGKMGDVMIAKVAEALALRRAFPQDLSGIYTSEEMQQADGTEASPAPQGSSRGKPPAKPSGKPAGRATQQQTRSEDVLCAHCSGKNGHTSDCPTLDKNKEKPQVAKEAEFEARIVVTSVEDKETVKKAKFQVLKAAKEDGDAIDLYVWHGTLRENTKHLKDVWSDVVIKSKPSTKDPNALIYSLDKVLRTFPDGDTVEWIDNVPTNPDAEPEA